MMMELYSDGRTLKDIDMCLQMAPMEQEMVTSVKFAAELGWFSCPPDLWATWRFCFLFFLHYCVASSTALTFLFIYGFVMYGLKFFLASSRLLNFTCIRAYTEIRWWFYRCELQIISDANSHFIKVILEKHCLQSYFTKVHTNPALVAENGALRVLPSHPENNPPHGCKLCPPNMCKVWCPSMYSDLADYKLNFNDRWEAFHGEI